MNSIPNFQDMTYLREKQYKNSANLGARAELHRRFGTAVTPWHPWVFEHLGLAAVTAVLECGCGPGWLWRENRERIPPGCQITLTDLSAGMVAEAEAALADSGHDFQWQTADIQQLPFPDASFDVVIANHMLYHVPDLAQALREVRRVLKGDGRFIAATNGRNHLRELWQIGLELGIGVEGNFQGFLTNESLFQLENGAEWLTAVFPQVSIFRYEDELVVTEAEPILNFLLSTSLAAENQMPTPETIAQVRQRLTQQIARDGAVAITKETGLFVASG
jgi:ubiquinone/menaquinone biosynthesis C-methylase UbiE